MYKILLKRPRLIQWFFLLAVLFFLSPMGFGVAQEPKTEQEPLKYESSVSVQLVPLFAQDHAGNPVYDLQQTEMELLVDGKVMPIIFFEAYYLEQQETTNATNPEVTTPTVPVKTPERINFIILDTMISNLSILELSQMVAAKIIQQGSAGDAFVILESNQINGFQYVIGPTKNKTELHNGLIEIKKHFDHREMWDSFMRGFARGAKKTGNSSSDEISSLMAAVIAREKAEKQLYRRDINFFSNSLMQLKYALRSTTLPKSVFLISTQSRIDELDEGVDVTYRRFLEEAAQSVNYGGALFYLINPMRQKEGRGAELKFMADAAGGKFISGQGIQDILLQIKKSTSAYYEMAFNTTAKEGQKNTIKINCKRKGVTLTTINHCEQERSYAKMNETERKMFLINIINGGSWSSMSIPIKQIKYTFLNPPQKKDSQLKTIELAIPAEIQNRQCHLYQLNMDETTQKADLVVTQKILTAKEQMTFHMQAGKKKYFVLINATGTICFYNQVI